MSLITFPKRYSDGLLSGLGRGVPRAVGLSIAAVVRVMKRSVCAEIYSQQFSLVWGLCFKLRWPSLETVGLGLSAIFRFILRYQFVSSWEQSSSTPSGMFTFLTGFCLHLHSVMCCYRTCPGKLVLLTSLS